MMKAVILAGGYGTRLRPLTFTTPKSMIPLVNKPVIGYIVDYLVGYGMKDIVITSTYLREQTINYLSKRTDLKLSYPEEPTPLGTAGSVKNAGITDTALIIQGDNITDMDIRKVLKFHKAHGKLVTIALLPVPDPTLYGIAEKESNGRITKFKEKPSPNERFSNLANTGLYIIEPEAMDYVPEGIAFDFSKDLFPILVAKNEVYGCVVEGFWTDVGNPDGYMAASRWILETKGSECADTAVIENSEIHGNVAIGEHAVVKQSEIRGPAVIGNHVEIIKSEVHDAVVFAEAKLRKTSLSKSVVGENAVINEVEILDTILGACSVIKEGARVKGSRIWPFTNLPSQAIVHGNVKRFVKMEGSEKKDLLCYLSEEEAFYFYVEKENDGRIALVDTGLVARSLEEFLEILTRIDYGSIEYHLKGDVNDFCEWINVVFEDEELSDEVKRITLGSRTREMLIEKLNKRINSYSL